jgi:hypothetical protein
MLEAYYEAIRLNLELGFISILKEELDARGITIEEPKGIQFVKRSI